VRHKLPGLVSLTILCFFLQSPAAQADSFATIDVNASFISLLPDGITNQSLANGPSFYVTGQFTLDEQTGTLSAWNMSFLGQQGVTYNLSALNGGVGSADCPNTLGSCVFENGAPPGSGGFYFSFANANAHLTMDTLFNSGGPLFVGESLQVCPLQLTYYDNSFPALSPPCGSTSTASFGNISGAMYELQDGSRTSGILTVTEISSTPEPSGAAIILLAIPALSLKYRSLKRKS
jgi:hypothetical protein